MQINVNLDKDFEREVSRLRKEYGEEMERINGFHEDNLNFTNFIDNFIDTDTVADVTIDGNANSSTKDVRTLMSDMMKPHTKLLSFNKIFYDAKKKYGLEFAKEWLEREWTGSLHMHDSATSSLLPYCYSYDLKPLVDEGLFFITRFKTGAAKHLTTFNDHVLEFISWTSNRSSGAVGLANYLFYSYYFWMNDSKNMHFIRDPEYYKRQCFQKFIYDLNQPYLRVTECAFTNISIMDRNYLVELFGGETFPNGEYAIDHIDAIIEYQKDFMEVVSEIRHETFMTYPVLTYALLYEDGEFKDKEFARWCSDHNCNWYDSNFYMGSDVSTLSNCCFDGKQEVSIYKDKKIYVGNLKYMYSSFKDEKIYTMSDGEWKECRVVRQKARKMYVVTTENNEKIYVTDNHLNPTLNGDKKTEDLTTDDFLLFDDGYDTLWKSNTRDNIEISKVEDNKLYWKIKDISRYEYDDEYVYCLEMKDETNPYFTLPNGIVTHNCRLTADTSKLKGFVNSIGGSGLSIGSIKVNTINLRRIALESIEHIDKNKVDIKKIENKFIDILKDRIGTCILSLDVVRNIIKRNAEKGLLPNYTYNIVDFNKQYNTVGVGMMFEALEELGLIKEDQFGYTYYSDEAIDLACRIMETIDKEKEKYDFDYSINIEAPPLEQAGVRLSKKDSILYPSAKKYNVYSNQWIPLTKKCTIQEKLKLASILDKACGGGVISHINIDGRFANKDQAWDMLNNIAKSGVVYFAFNTKISICKREHGFFGEICDKCGLPKSDTYSRIVGFLVPESSYSQERKEEFKDRKWYNIENKDNS